MFGRFRVLVSVSAAFPISPLDGDAVYNFRGSLDTGHFLGQLFRTLGGVLHLPNQATQQTRRVVPPPLPRTPQKARPSNEDQGDEEGLQREIQSNESPTSFTTSFGATARSSFPPLRNGSRSSSGKKKKTCCSRPRVLAAKKKLSFENSPSPPQKSKPNLRLFPAFNHNQPQRTRWEVSAETLLNMTLTFLRNVPERVVTHPKNRSIIKKLFDLTGEDTVNDLDTSATIRWAFVVALNLLHLKSVPRVNKHQQSLPHEHKEMSRRKRKRHQIKP